MSENAALEQIKRDNEALIVEIKAEVMRLKDYYVGEMKKWEALMGVVLSKTGPVRYGEDDYELYQFAKLRPQIVLDLDGSGRRIELVSTDGE